MKLQAKASTDQNACANMTPQDFASRLFTEVLPVMGVFNAALLLIGYMLRRIKVPTGAWAFFGVLLIACAMWLVAGTDGKSVGELSMSVIVASLTWAALGANFLSTWLVENASKPVLPGVSMKDCLEERT